MRGFSGNGKELELQVDLTILGPNNCWFGRSNVAGNGHTFKFARTNLFINDGANFLDVTIAFSQPGAAQGILCDIHGTSTWTSSTFVNGGFAECFEGAKFVLTNSNIETSRRFHLLGDASILKGQNDLGSNVINTGVFGKFGAGISKIQTNFDNMKSLVVDFGILELTGDAATQRVGNNPQVLPKTEISNEGTIDRTGRIFSLRAGELSGNGTIYGTVATAPVLPVFQGGFGRRLQQFVAALSRPVVIHPGLDAAPGTLTVIGNLLLTPATRIVIDTGANVNAAPVIGRLIVQDLPNKRGGTIESNGATIDIRRAAGFTPVWEITVFDSRV